MFKKQTARSLASVFKVSLCELVNDGYRESAIEYCRHKRLSMWTDECKIFYAESRRREDALVR